VAFIGGGPVPLLGGIPAPFKRRDELYVFALPRAGVKATTVTTLGAATAAIDANNGQRAGSANEAGKAIFVSHCGSCHTLQAAGTTGTAGPNLGVAGRLITQVVTSAVTRGKSGPLGTMPAFSGTLTKDEIERVAAYVAETSAR
jgi:mono/diheme cytochrome c family protein